jgi:1-acyl-sn-glycerol-3-phosphate acyltransferase
MIYGLSRLLARFLFAAILDVRVRGLEHVPDRGPAILVANHPCALDGYLLVSIVRRRFYCFNRAENFSNPIIGAYLRAAGALPVKPGSDNRASLRRAEQLLRAGHLFTILPEGDVNPGPSPWPFKASFLTLALAVDAPVIPIAIVGSQAALIEPRRPRTLWQCLPRPATIYVDVLPPIRFEQPQGDRELFSAHLARVRDAIAERVRALSVDGR